MFSMCWSGLDQRSWSRPVFAAGQLRARLALRASRAYYASWPKASLLFVMLSEGQHDSRALDWPKASLVRPKIIKEQAGRRPACVASSGGRRPPDLLLDLVGAFGLSTKSSLVVMMAYGHHDSRTNPKKIGRENRPIYRPISRNWFYLVKPQ